MAVEEPVGVLAGVELNDGFFHRRHVDRVLERRVLAVLVQHPEKVAVQVHGMVHHGQVVERDAHDFALFDLDFVGLRQRHPVHAPDVAPHIAGQIEYDAADGLVHVGVGGDGRFGGRPEVIVIVLGEHIHARHLHVAHRHVVHVPLLLAIHTRHFIHFHLSHFPTAHLGMVHLAVVHFRMIHLFHFGCVAPHFHSLHVAHFAMFHFGMIHSGRIHAGHLHLHTPVGHHFLRFLVGGVELGGRSAHAHLHFGHLLHHGDLVGLGDNRSGKRLASAQIGRGMPGAVLGHGPDFHLAAGRNCHDEIVGFGHGDEGLVMHHRNDVQPVGRHQQRVRPAEGEPELRGSCRVDDPDPHLFARLEAGVVLHQLPVGEEGGIIDVGDVHRFHALLPEIELRP